MSCKGCTLVMCRKCQLNVLQASVGTTRPLRQWHRLPGVSMSATSHTVHPDGVARQAGILRISAWCVCLGDGEAHHPRRLPQDPPAGLGGCAGSRWPCRRCPRRNQDLGRPAEYDAGGGAQLPSKVVPTVSLGCCEHLGYSQTSRPGTLQVGTQPDHRQENVGAGVNTSGDHPESSKLQALNMDQTLGHAQTSIPGTKVMRIVTSKFNSTKAPQKQVFSFWHSGSDLRRYHWDM